MTRHQKRRTRALAGLLTVLGLALVACGDSSTSPATTRLSIMLTDAAGGIEQAWVEVTRVYLQGTPGASGEQVTLLDESTGLTNLQSLAAVPLDLVSDAVLPAGVYAQLRFVFGDAVIETTEGKVYATPGAVPLEGVAIDGELQCPSCSESGFKVNLPGGALKLEADAMILAVDFDVPQSFGHTAGASSAWVMHPVLNASDFEVSGGIAGNVQLDDGVDLSACGAALTDFVPLAVSGEIQKSGSVSEAGTYTISLLEPGDYTLDYTETIELESSTITFEATVDPASVSVGTGLTASADYTITSCSAS